jgi:hypothetical protein
MIPVLNYTPIGIKYDFTGTKCEARALNLIFFYNCFEYVKVQE